ncbi:zinc finger, PHD-type containing protein [Tanacetum coccineum]|uniref:Zinc finger, PHD-type containing protein n=1 Tax=Tanacetum coccineum TaxID=301880 RepID=A0ABQ4Y657_9ASTR
MSDMIALLNDLSYIPPNNEQNEPTQGDIGETSNEPTQAKRNKFEELYASANEELYPGCDYVTRLDFMAKFTYFKVKGQLTDSMFNEMLEFFQHVFPTTKGYKLPPSYYAIKKTFKMIGLGYESIHAYVNDCFLFRGDNNKDVHCPVCKTSRWKDSSTPRKKVPKKVLRYFSIIPRLQRLYKSSHTAKEMTWHATGKCTEPGKMQHPVDGRAWKNFDTKYPNFAKEPRNVRLGLAADGFNPFGNLSQAYSMWPVILTTYNLPPWLCMKESSFMLTLLIPGPKSPGKDIDVYLRPLIDDLKVLWALKGVETIDVATGQKFNMRAMVLWTINDFPARSSLSGWSGQGYKACPTCNEDTPSVRVLGKTAYVGHRRFLKKPHKWRRSLEFNGEIEDGDPPRKFDRDQIQAQLARLPTRVKGKHPSYGGVKIKRNVLVELNWTKRSIFYELEYWSFLTLKHNLDIMHIEKNVLEAILNTLLMNDKSKDTAKARQDLKKLGIRSGLWLGQTKNGKCSKPQAAYSFSPENRKKFCQFIKGVKLPDGFGSNFKHKVTDNDTNITGLKSHDCHIMMQRLLPYGLQQYLPDEVAKPIIELCSFFKQICSATLMEDDMLKAQIKWSIFCAISSSYILLLSLTL